MTCIVAIEHEGKVYMGGDSSAAGGWDMSVIDFSKVFRSGDFLIGYTTSFRMGQLLEHELVVAKQENESDMHYMITKFIPAVRELFKGAGFTKIDSNREEGGKFLVGYKGKVYRIDDDYQALRYRNGMYSVGCGYAYALGALASNETDAPEKRILKSLEIAGIFSNGVCPPYYVVTA
jgi:ATP-dependent protease HslVU (ClpYQ) peptidase subunit